jgi:hypothetical protein
VRDGVEAPGQIRIVGFGESFLDVSGDFLDGLVRVSLRPESVGVVLEVGFQDDQAGGLHDPVPDGGDAQGAFGPVSLGDVDPADRRGAVGPGLQLVSNVREEGFGSLRLDVLEVDSDGALHQI